MAKIFSGVGVGRKNIVFGAVLFLLLGVAVGIPLTLDFLDYQCFQGINIKSGRLYMDMGFSGVS
ncbi:MAG: hypothetical protein JSW12_13530 [Deltaproteobacteria bacterium]|nr:MAG: hypothetical protein JSW12_13530 [Deltaproteobacteria bacterium]